MSGSDTGGFGGPRKTQNSAPLTKPFIDKLPMALKNAEYKYTFPKGTKFFEVRLINQSFMKVSYTPTGITLGTSFFRPGNLFGMDGMILPEPLDVFFQSTQDNDTLEIHYWT